MNTVQKILFGMGIFYIVLGGCLSIIFIRIGFGVFVLIPLLFFVLGIAFVVGVCVSSAKKKRILKHGHRYAAKIYSYVENTAYLVNGSYTVNIKVHYFDENHVEREAIIPTGFEKGSGMRLFLGKRSLWMTSLLVRSKSDLLQWNAQTAAQAFRR